MIEAFYSELAMWKYAFLAVVIVGCQKQTQTVSETRPAVTATVDPQFQTFKEWVVKFTAEAKSVNNAAELLPSLATFSKRKDLLEEIFTRIPDRPAGNALAEEYHKACKQILLSMEVHELALSTLTRYSAQMTADEKTSAVNRLKMLVGKFREEINELESAINLNRAPKKLDAQ